MTSRRLLLTGLVAVTVVSAGIAQELMPRLDGPIDVQALRAQTLGEVLPEVLLPEEPAPPRPGNARLWGIAVAPVPELLAMHCPPLRDGRGLLITDVARFGPADDAGLRAGQILLQVDDNVLYRPSDLQRPNADAVIELLVQGEVVTTTLEPKPHPGLARPADAAVAAPAFERMPREALSGSVFSDGAPGAEAISIAGANGRYKITAVVTTEDGPERVMLRGTRGEIEEQLDGLPRSVRGAVRRRLSQVDVP